mmetsp:Transcript_11958/g.31441  ORF Transcript_11958/g.31441 Transcript_11958/m.31441 type:complete len:122 (-) Transcript_11958:288-653(-)
MLTGADDLDHVLRPTAYTLVLSTKSAGLVGRRGSTPPPRRPSPRPAKVGTNKDQDKHHNCCGGGGSCGWHWCEYSKSCKQVWEECSKDDKPTRGGDVDKHGCKVSEGEYWDGSKCANVRGD